MENVTNYVKKRPRPDHARSHLVKNHKRHPASKDPGAHVLNPKHTCLGLKRWLDLWNSTVQYDLYD